MSAAKSWLKPTRTAYSTGFLLDKPFSAAYAGGVSAANYNLSISCGEDFNFTLRVVDSYQDAVDFSSSTFIAEIREEHKKPLVTAFTVTSEGNGTLKLALTDTQTKLLSPSRQYKWDFFWTKAGVTTKLLYGNVNAVGNISNV